MDERVLGEARAEDLHLGAVATVDGRDGGEVGEPRSVSGSKSLFAAAARVESDRRAAVGAATERFAAGATRRGRGDRGGRDGGHGEGRHGERRRRHHEAASTECAARRRSRRTLQIRTPRRSPPTRWQVARPRGCLGGRNKSPTVCSYDSPNPSSMVDGRPVGPCDFFLVLRPPVRIPGSSEQPPRSPRARAGIGPCARGRSRGPSDAHRSACVVSRVSRPRFARPVPGAPRLGALPRRRGLVATFRGSRHRGRCPSAEDLPSGVRSPSRPPATSPPPSTNASACSATRVVAWRAFAARRARKTFGGERLGSPRRSPHARGGPQQDPRRAGGARTPRLPPLPPRRALRLPLLPVRPGELQRRAYVEKRSAVDPNLDASGTAPPRRSSADAVARPSVSCLYGLGMPADYVDARLVLDSRGSRVGATRSRGTHRRPSLLRIRRARDAALRRICVGRRSTTRRPRAATGSLAAVRGRPLEIELDREGVLLERGRGTSNDADADGSSPPLRATTTAGSTRPPIARRGPRRRFGARWWRARLSCARRSHIEAERLEQRTTADVGLLEELGWCPGAALQPHPRAAPRRPPPAAPRLPQLRRAAKGPRRERSRRWCASRRRRCDRHRRGWLLVADESHVMLPQPRDARRRSIPVANCRGGIAPSALDNRPPTFDEFWERVPQRCWCPRRPARWRRCGARRNRRRPGTLRPRWTWWFGRPACWTRR